MSRPRPPGWAARGEAEVRPASRQAGGKPQASTPQYIMPTYVGVLSSAIARAMEASAKAHYDTRLRDNYRARILALWNILPPDVRKAVSEKLGASHPDKYADEKAMQRAKELENRLKKKYGDDIEGRAETCLNPRRPLLSSTIFNFYGPSKFCEDVEEAINATISSWIRAYDTVLQTIIDELHRYGWLAREEATRLGRER